MRAQRSSRRGGVNVAPVLNTPEEAARLAAQHIPLVHYLAKQFYSNAISLEDRISEGMVGLMIGAQRFDASRGSKPSVYLGFWIKSLIFMALQRQLGVRGPRDRRVFGGLGRATERLERRGVEPTAERLAAELDVDMERVARLQARLRGDVHLDALPGDRQAWLADEETPEDGCAKAQSTQARAKAIATALKCLLPRERDVVMRRYLTESPETLHEIGESLGLSRERIRQIEKRAMAKMQRVLEPRMGGL